MLSDHSLRLIQAFWEAHLGCETGLLFASQARAVQHGSELADYEGVFVLFREGRVVLSVPHDVAGKTSLSPAMKQAFQKWLCCQDFTPDRFVEMLEPFVARVVGPAFIGYADTVYAADVDYAVRPLAEDDAKPVEALQAACDAMEWEHGGSSLKHVCSGVFVGSQLVALAGYEVWGGMIAHISVVTHPGHRGKGYGRSAVAHVARRALEAGLLPQYRTLMSNGPSIRIAESLGFERWAVSVALRFDA